MHEGAGEGIAGRCLRGLPVTMEKPPQANLIAVAAVVTLAVLVGLCLLCIGGP